MSLAAVLWSVWSLVFCRVYHRFRCLLIMTSIKAIGRIELTPRYLYGSMETRRSSTRPERRRRHTATCVHSKPWANPNPMPEPFKADALFPHPHIVNPRLQKSSTCGRCIARAFMQDAACSLQTPCVEARTHRVIHIYPCTCAGMRSCLFRSTRKPRGEPSKHLAPPY